MLSSRHLAPILAVAAHLLAAPRAVGAQAPAPPPPAAVSPFAVDLSVDQARVTTGGVRSTWRSERVQVSWVKPDAGGWFVGAERLERYGMHDASGFLRAYKRAGDWTVAGGVAATPRALFYFRHSADVELSRRVVGTLVASAGYRYMKFSSVEVQQAQPGLTLYHGYASLGARVFLTRRDFRGPVSRTVLVQAGYESSPRVRLSAGAAYGERVYDVGQLADGRTPTTRVAFATARFGLTRRNAIEIGGTLAREGSGFEYRSILAGYRRLF